MLVSNVSNDTSVLYSLFPLQNIWRLHAKEETIQKAFNPKHFEIALNCDRYFKLTYNFWQSA